MTKLLVSQVEKHALEHTDQKLIYPPYEKIGVIVVNSFPELGRLTAMRFIEWVQDNPDGVIALPTGKTPEYFIKEVKRFLEGWNHKDIRKELEAGGIDTSKRCNLQSLHFIQIDEFYPINPMQQNSFYYYVNKYYLESFGIDPQRAMLIDCSSIGLPADKSLEEIWPDGEVDLSLRYRRGKTKLEYTQKEVLERIDQWCTEYESQIRKLGGIGFFLGGIGPDGHIGFNVKGSDLFSTTRLARTNYKTQAAAASDLGGIEIARKRLVITIGLSTITYNPNCVAIIMAAGDTKAEIVSGSVVSERKISYPASVLQDLESSRFYITSSAAAGLEQRQLIKFLQQDKLIDSIDLIDARIEKTVIDLALQKDKKIVLLNEDDFKSDPLSAEVLKRMNEPLSKITERISSRLKEKFEAGIKIYKNRVFLHTEPHHDDLMLGYLPYIVRHIREHSCRHFFASMTSGFTAVTNEFMLGQLKKLKKYIGTDIFSDSLREGYFEPENHIYRNRDVWQYLDGVAANYRAVKDDGEMRRLYRNMIEIFDEQDTNILESRIDELINYFETQYPGKKDLDYIQKLKGMCREWEADCLWGFFGWNSDSVRHLRLGFYSGDIFTEDPTLKRDIPPILKLLREVKPNVVTLALDPEASGPDTHYKVMQAVTEALKVYEKENSSKKIEILGYRNVWYRFHPSEADMFIPVSLNMFFLQKSAFMNTFISQKTASFPSYAHDGPFPELAQKIQVDQYMMLKKCLGREFFYEHQSALVRATRGLVFLKRMSLKELINLSRNLRKNTENM